MLQKVRTIISPPAALKYVTVTVCRIAVLWTKLNGVMITPEILNCTGCRLEGVKMPSSDKLCPLVPFSCFASNSALRSYITYTHNNTQHSELLFSIEKIDALT